MVLLKGREPEWSNPQIEDGKLPEMAINHTIKGKVCKNVNPLWIIEFSQVPTGEAFLNAKDDTNDSSHKLVKIIQARTRTAAGTSTLNWASLMATLSSQYHRPLPDAHLPPEYRLIQGPAAGYCKP